jgi:hypothetical protein
LLQPKKRSEQVITVNINPVFYKSKGDPVYLKSSSRVGNLAGCLVLTLLYGCVTPQKPEPESAEKRVAGPAFYVLREGERLDYPMPLPNRTQILVDWTYSDGAKHSKEGFRGWDVNHDGRFDMVEVLDQAGKPVAWAYDFNGDSVIDAVEHASKVSDAPIGLPPVSPSH